MTRKINTSYIEIDKISQEKLSVIKAVCEVMNLDSEHVKLLIINNS